eukprot:219959_1
MISRKKDKNKSDETLSNRAENIDVPVVVVKSVNNDNALPTPQITQQFDANNINNINNSQSFSSDIYSVKLQNIQSNSVNDDNERVRTQSTPTPSITEHNALPTPQITKRCDANNINNLNNINNMNNMNNMVMNMNLNINRNVNMNLNQMGI